MIARVLVIGLIAVGGLLPGCAAEPGEARPGRMRVAVLPNASEPMIRMQHEPLIEYLASETGLDFELSVPASYAALVDHFGAGEYQLAWFGGLTFAKAQLLAGAVPLVSRDIDLRFTSSFVVRGDAPESSIEDFRGRSFTFGPRLSTSGHLMPRHFLATRGIEAERFFGDVLHSKSHDRTLRAIREGRAAIGAVDSAVLASMLRNGSLAESAFRVIDVTPVFTNYVWATSASLDETTRSSLLNAFLDLDPSVPEHARILEAHEAHGFLPVGPEDFEDIQRVASRMDLL